MALFPMNIGSGGGTTAIKSVLWQYAPRLVAIVEDENPTFTGDVRDIPSNCDYTATVEYGSGYYRCYFYSSNGGKYLWMHIENNNLTSDAVEVSAGGLIYSRVAGEGISTSRTIIFELK